MASVHQTPVMLFGFQQYTSVWSGHARATTDLTDWVHVPAKNLVSLQDTLSQFPKLQVLVVDVFNDLLKELNPMDLISSLSETLGGFYNHLERSFDLNPKLKVSLFTLSRVYDIFRNSLPFFEHFYEHLFEHIREVTSICYTEVRFSPDLIASFLQRDPYSIFLAREFLILEF